ncbi:hypothetical protein A9D14_15640 (plasmid) [Croceicoccus marinus]|uniref:Uncharacterized protein n=1 Tax=Croceicoccus marinus TaxID=450378 RepID=A0A1Z1FGE1_9SPHN|nr:hypothetical protein A9D14_15640 [Croceicoccus marinus]
MPEPFAVLGGNAASMARNCAIGGSYEGKPVMDAGRGKNYCAHWPAGQRRQTRSSVPASTIGGVGA